MISTKQVAFLFLCAILIVGLATLTCGIYFDGGSDIYAYHVIRGNFTSSPVYYFSSFGFYAFSSSAVAGLYKWCPSFAWFDLLVFLNLTLCIFLLFILWYTVRHKSPVILFLLFIIPWLDNILMPELTKQGFWIGILSLVIYHTCDHRLKWLRIVMVLLFGYAFMIRAESVFLAFISFYLYKLIYSLITDRSKLIQIHKELLPFFFFVILFSLLFNTNFSGEDRSYRSFRPYQFTLWDFGQDPSTLKLDNTSDSVIIQSAQNRFVSDTSKINSRFFERVGLHSKDKTLSSLAGYFENPSFLLKKSFREVSSARAYLVAILIFAFLFLIVLQSSTTVTNKEKISQTAIFGACLLLLLFLSVFMKLERHVVIPLLMGCILYFICYSPAHRSLKIWQMGMLALASGFLTYNVYLHYIFQRSVSENSSALCADINKRFPDSIIYIDLYTMVTLHKQLFVKDDFPYARSLSFDNAIISLYPGWEEKMKKLNQPAEMEKLGDKFIHDSTKTIFIFNKGREHLFERYFSSVYGKRCIFEELTSPFSAEVCYPYSYYRVLKKTK